MKTEEYLRKKLRLLYISLALNILGTVLWTAIAIALWMLWAKGTI